MSRIAVLVAKLLLIKKSISSSLVLDIEDDVSVSHIILQNSVRDRTHSVVQKMELSFNTIAETQQRLVVSTIPTDYKGSVRQ